MLDHRVDERQSGAGPTSIKFFSVRPCVSCEAITVHAAVIGTSGQLALALRRHSLPRGFSLIPAEKVNVADRAALFSLLERDRPDLVINASGYTAVDKAETEREQAFRINADGPHWLAQWCNERGSTLIHVSTDYVFDGRQTTPYSESTAANPLNVYGASKLAGEVRIADALERHVIVRTSWVFSADGQNFVKTMLRLANEREELRIVSDQHGRPTAANDLASALWRVATRLAEGAQNYGTFHFAGAGATTWYDFAGAIMGERSLEGLPAPRLVPIMTADYPTPAPRPAHSVLETSRFESAFDVSPRPWRIGLREALALLLR
jgi:dTDP-4-dehydrorhamnose reductase